MSENKKMYIGNLPWKTDEGELRKKFEQFGVVHSIHMISDRETNKFRGFAFVEMDPSDADNAMKALHESDFGGRPMIVNEARPKEKRQGGGGGGNRAGRGGDGGPYDNRRDW